jgi:DDE superfamily endonuclease
MEDVLDVYEAPYDRRFPVVCMDESPKQLIEETRVPIPMQPGQPARYDSEYKRNGTCCVFGFCEPKRCWRELVVTERRTMQDFAWGIKCNTLHLMILIAFSMSIRLRGLA